MDEKRLMPQPLSPNVKSWSPNPAWVLDHRPECVTAIGLTALAWTRVENELVSMMSGITGRTSQGNDGGYGISPNRIAAAALREAETIRVKIKIVDALLKPMIDGDSLSEEWEKLSDRLYKVSRKRNEVVHSEWAWSEDAPNGVIQVISDGRSYLWVEKDFQDVFARIKAVEIDVHEFMKQVLGAIHSRRITRYVSADMIVD